MLEPKEIGQTISIVITTLDSKGDILFIIL
jgi:hypothetical protein